MPYIADPDDATAPLESVLAGTAADDFRRLKGKVNNLFLESDYDSALMLQPIKAGTHLMLSIPAGAATGIAYGHAVDVTRNDLNGAALVGVAAVGAQLNARLGPNLNAPFVKDMYVFGYASEAWTDPVASQATLIGGEMAVISQYNANTMPLVGCNIVFKNMSDIQKTGANVVHQGLGADKYNANSKALFFTAFARSLSGERCGWGRGIVFADSCFDSYFDQLAGVYKQPVGIDFTEQDGPFTSEPWTAFITPLKSGISSALALAEYMSITWDRLQFTRTYLDSDNDRFVIFGDGASPTTIARFCFDYNNNYLELPTQTVTGAPAAADASIKIKVSGNEYFMHLTAV